MKYRLTKKNDTICIVQPKYWYNDISQYDRALIEMYMHSYKPEWNITSD